MSIYTSALKQQKQVAGNEVKYRILQPSSNGNIVLSITESKFFLTKMKAKSLLVTLQAGLGGFVLTLAIVSKYVQ